MSRPALLGSALTVLLLACGFTARTKAQVLNSYSPPRLADGTPDFRGIWRAQTTAYVNIEGHAAEPGLPASNSIVVDPPDGKIPYLPDALKQRDKNYAERTSTDPRLNCFQAGVPRAVLLPTPFQFFESVGYLAIVYQDDHAYRIVLPSTVPHDDGIDFYMGDSRGHWERNTLVIDVTDLGDATWLDGAGNYHSDQLHVVERYTLLGPDKMNYEASIDDPMVYAKQWTIRLSLYRDKERGARIVEDECIEDSQGIWQHVSPFDPKALLRHDYQSELQTAKKSQ
jgi:hypothetical protein